MNMDTYDRFLLDNGISTTVAPDPEGKPGHHVITFHGDGMALTAPFHYLAADLRGRSLEGWCLNALAHDCATLDAALDDFRDWCAELGFDPDEDDKESDFSIVTGQRDRLREMLGDDLFEELLYRTQ